MRDAAAPRTIDGMDQTTPPAPTQPPSTQRGGGFFAGVRRLGLWRSDNRWIGGVAAGLGERYGLDPLLVRGIFAATALLGGLGFLLYGVAWALLPEQRDGRIHLEETLAGRFDVALLGALAFVVLGLGRGDTSFWWGGLPAWMTAIGWIAVVGVVIAVLVVATNHRSSARRAAVPYGGVPPYGPPPGSPGQPPTAHTAAPAFAAQTTAAGPGDDTPTAVYPAAAGTSHPAGTYPAGTYPTGPTATYAAGAPPTQYGGPYGPYGPGGGVTPPYGPGVPPAPPRPARPPRPSGPGVATLGVVVALSLLTLAGLLVAHRAGHFNEPLLLTALGVAIVLAGIGIVVAGLRGRTSGVLGGLAILGLVAAVPLGVVTTNDWHVGQHRHAVALDVAPVSRQVAEQGWSFGVGDTTLDLTRVPLTSSTLVVPVSVGAGDLTVVVPADASVTADVRVGAGQINWDVVPGSKQDSGFALRDSFATPGAGTEPQIHLNVSAGAGTVRVEEQ
jgi:phage shock protein PspC (stress-responsive transcriptional regulator)